MDQIDLSFICSGVRVEKWRALLDSFFQMDSSLTMEAVCLGPYKPPAEVTNDSRISFILDEGAPIRGIQRGVLAAKGSYVMWCSDDCIFMHGAQDMIWNMINGQDRKTVVLGKYTEGEGRSKRGKKNWKMILHDSYYAINTCMHTASLYIPNHWLIGNNTYIDRSYFMELGGLDCRFEGVVLATTDWAIRAQRDGAKFILAQIKELECPLEGANEGAHGAIYNSFWENDLPLYQAIHRDPNSVNRIKIDFDNWKDTPEVWRRRISKQKIYPPGTKVGPGYTE